MSVAIFSSTVKATVLLQITVKKTLNFIVRSNDDTYKTAQTQRRSGRFYFHTFYGDTLLVSESLRMLISRLLICHRSDNRQEKIWKALANSCENMIEWQKRIEYAESVIRYRAKFEPNRSNRSGDMAK